MVCGAAAAQAVSVRMVSLTQGERVVVTSALVLLLHSLRQDEARGDVPRADAVEHLIAMRDVERLAARIAR